MKLIDFFTKFDKDGSMTVSRDEFKGGIYVYNSLNYIQFYQSFYLQIDFKGLGINFSVEEMNELIHELDPDNDGEINYR